MKEILFNPFFPAHKSIIGAVRSDEIVTLTIKITKKFDIYDLRLIVKDDYNNVVLSLSCDKYTYGFLNDFDYNMYKVDIIGLSKGLYWYCFEVDDYYGTHYISSSKNLDAVLVDYVPLYWELLVHDNFRGNLDWYKGKVMYQIMVDRFNKSGEYPPKPGAVIHENWNDEPYYKPVNGVYAIDFFGGTLRGIIDKLDYLVSLNVGVIYLNPIFEAQSNHKYDTGDYMKIDPMFGTEEDFVELCTKAKEKNIGIILDGVFNHTGDNSIYFNKYNTYDVVGACQSKESPYYSWFKFYNHPFGYDSWWGFTTLPAVNQKSKEYLEFITGEDGVIKKWLRLGASGFRLDVVDELNNDFVVKISNAVKSVSNEKILLGEVWEDASHKVAYSEKKNYFHGYELDSVMNYPFRTAIIDYVKYNNYTGLQNTIRNIINNYPKHVVDVLMNMLDTHDTVRIINAFCNCDFNNMSNDDLSRYVISSDEMEKAIKKVKMATAINYTLPGVPSIFYGDEAGVTGFKDPFCRKTYPWGSENEELLDWYKRLGEIRKDPVYVDGKYIEDHIGDGIFSFIRRKDGVKIITIANNSNKNYKYSIESGHDLINDVIINKEIIVLPQTVAIVKLLPKKYKKDN